MGGVGRHDAGYDLSDRIFRRRESLEAGWKYLILCSVGIALALFGIVLTYYSSVRVLGDVSAALNITSLIGVADRLDPHVLKLAFIFILVGYGTKVGLVPMHTWLPEAYSEAPAPVAAMLAGRAGNGRGLCDLRSKILVDQALPPEFSANLLMLFGFISFAVAAFFMLIQHNYKRLFAYSSIEHMGLAMIGFGIGGRGGDVRRALSPAQSRAWPKHWPFLRPAISIGDSIRWN